MKIGSRRLGAISVRFVFSSIVFNSIIALSSGQLHALGPPLLGAEPAAPKRVAVALKAAPKARCPATKQLEARVDACMSEAPASWSCPLATATVAVEATRRGVNATVVLRVGDRDFGVRRLVGQSTCDDVISAAALAICIGLDAVCNAPPTVSAAIRRPTAAALRQRRRPTAQSPTKAEQRAGKSPFPVRLGLAIVASRAVAPATSAGLSLTAATDFGPVRLGAIARVDAPASAPFQGGTIGSSLAVAGLSICAERSALSVCAVQYAGLKHVFGLGFDRDVAVWRSYLGTSLRAGWTAFWRAPFGVALFVQADVPWWLDHIEVQAEDAGTNVTEPVRHRWTTPRVGLTVGLEFVYSGSK